jgi:hypothetical protein
MATKKSRPKSAMTDDQLREVQRYAHQVRGEHPDMKWTQCVAEGYRRYKHSK